MFEKVNWKGECEMREEYKIAFEKAKDVLSRINYDGTDMVKSSDVIKAVSEMTGMQIRLIVVDFKKFKSNKRFHITEYYAALQLYKTKECNGVGIFVNSTRDPKMQRFALVHALGRIATGMLDDVPVIGTDPELKELSGKKASGKCRLLVHIDMDIDSISEEYLDNTEYDFMIKEQAANIFALLVLIPPQTVLEQMQKNDSIEEISRFFGVDDEAVISRVELGLLYSTES